LPVGAFVLAKYVRDREKPRTTQGHSDVQKWVWGGFFARDVSRLAGPVAHGGQRTYKAFLGVSWLALITCTFTLAKTLRIDPARKAEQKPASLAAELTQYEKNKPLIQAVCTALSCCLPPLLRFAMRAGQASSPERLYVPLPVASVMVAAAFTWGLW
jgi:hypothetical protein